MDMAGEMKVEVIRRETIKPSSPTPSHLKLFHLSFLDQVCPMIYTSVVLFYPKNCYLTYERSTEKLKKSLSEALTRFYPLAGKINNTTTIECSDDGATYVEARFKGMLSTFLEQPEDEVIKLLFPAKETMPEAAEGPLLLVQATYFECGGLAVAICVSHKLADVITLNMFLKAWAAAAVPSRGENVFPDLDFARSHFPPRDMSMLPPPQITDAVTKRFVIDKSKIAALKAKAVSERVKQPTRVEAVTALIWKCAIVASRLNSGSSKKNSFLDQVVNIRKRVEPQFPENSVGNLVSYFTVQVDWDEHELKVENLVAMLRDGIKEYSEKLVKKQGEGLVDMLYKAYDEIGDPLKQGDAELFICSSWCRIGFYEADFGWGMPIWFTYQGCSDENTIILMDSKDGVGVEVCLTLSQKNMASFEKDLELLAFAAFYEADLDFEKPTYMIIPRNAFKKLIQLMDAKMVMEWRFFLTLNTKENNMAVFENQIDNYILSSASSSY